MLRRRAGTVEERDRWGAAGDLLLFQRSFGYREPWYPSPISSQREEERPERATRRLAPASASLPGHLVRWVCQMVGLRDGYVWGVGGKNRYTGYSMCANVLLPPNAMLHCYSSGFANRCLGHRLDLCGHELLFVSAWSLTVYLQRLCAYVCVNVIAYHFSFTCCIGASSDHSYTLVCNKIISEQKWFTTLKHFNSALQRGAQYLIEIRIKITTWTTGPDYCFQTICLIVPLCKLITFY